MLLVTACGAPSTDLDDAQNTSSTTPATDDVNGDGYTDLPISGRTGDPETRRPASRTWAYCSADRTGCPPTAPSP